MHRVDWNVLLGLVLMAGWPLRWAEAQIITPAPAPLTGWAPGEVRDVALQIQSAADQARLSASRQTRPDVGGQTAALSDLIALSNAAQTLVSGLLQSTEGPAATREAFFTLVQVHEQARRSGLRAGYGAEVIQHLNTIGTLLGRLNIVYSQRWNRDLAVGAARRLAELAVRASEGARRAAPAGNAEDMRTLSLLQHLRISAEHFARLLDLGEEPPAIGEDLRTLSQDYAHAARHFGASSFAAIVQAELAGAGRELAVLERMYRVAWNSANARFLAEQSRGVFERMLAARSVRGVPAGEGEGRLLDDLATLTRAVDRLLRQLETAGQSAAQSKAEYIMLLSAYDQVSASLGQAPLGNEASSDFVRAGRLIHQMGRLYGLPDGGEAHILGTTTGP